MTSSVPPSSPPIAAEGALRFHVPSSPPTLALGRAAFPTTLRKRPYPVYDEPSSDPVFSDDALGTEDGSRYERPKQKRMLRMPWWMLSHKVKRTRERITVNDSGVFMGSDESMDEPGETASTSTQQPPSPQDFQPTPRSSAASLDDPRVGRRIQACLEDGYEIVDLSNLGLESLLSAALQPLHQLIREPLTFGTNAPPEDAFRPLTPALQIYLGQNKLTALPSELFRLRDTCVLSLRQNQLRTVPPAIRNLDKLEELNVAGNNITFLPWELLEIMVETPVILHPNPFLKPTILPPGVRPDKADRIEPQNPHIDGRWDDDPRALLRPPSFYSSSVEDEWMQAGQAEIAQPAGGQDPATPLHAAVSRNDTMSVVHAQERKARCVSSSHIAFLQQRHGAADETMRNGSPDLPPTGAGPPSLFELALRTVQHLLTPAQLVTLADESPSTVRFGLQAAVLGIEHGNERCSTCAREYIMPHAEWMEYWRTDLSASIASAVSVLPFRRRSCSAACTAPTILGTYR